ncbi:hypothetical protein LJB91_01100 [Bacteroidales bacterium OttesenSCG-928-L03]|nr:hypothetical protein [Bacteroidales bacterium OttesenSCG-928-L03]
MPIYYSIREIRSSLEGADKKLFYPVAKRWEMVSYDDLVQDMVRNTTLHSSEARAAMDFLVEAIPRFLEMGNSVSLGPLGYMKTRLTGEGSERKEDVTHLNIKDVRACFIASREFRDRIRNMPVHRFPEQNTSIQPPKYNYAMRVAKQREAEETARRCLEEGLSVEQTARISGLDFGDAMSILLKKRDEERELGDRK